jgi:hypothetical protein
LRPGVKDRQTPVWKDQPVDWGKRAALALDRVRRRGRRVPVVILVDVEPDKRTFPPDEPHPWSGFELMAEQVGPLRERLSEITGEPVSLSWFMRMDPQVERTWGSPTWAAEEYGKQFAELEAAGDELALHTHTWRIDEDRGEWIADFADAGYAEHCLEVGLAAFEEAFGRPPRLHRFGDHFLTGPLLATLAGHGIQADFSLEPGWPATGPTGPWVDERWNGRLPDMRAVPNWPYRSSVARFPEPDEERPLPTLLVPLYSPPGLRRRQRLPLPPDSNHFTSRLAFELTTRTPSLMALTLRSDASLDRWERTVSNLEHLARHPNMRFVTASEGVGQIQG